MDTNTLLKHKIPCAETGIEIKKTICSICESDGTSCGINAYIKDDRVIKVEGNPDFLPTHGSLCSKGQANRQYIYNKERVLTPMKRVGPRGSDDFEAITWDEAHAIIKENLLKIKKEYGAESVVFGGGFTKWLRPFTQRLALSFGSPNFCTESSTCFFATAFASMLTYGSWFGGPDIGNTDCLLIWTLNFSHTYTPMAQVILERKRQGMQTIEVGPMDTPFTRHADIHLPIRPGTDGALALGFAHVIINEDLYDHEFIENYTHGFEEFRQYVQEFTPERVQEITGAPAQDVAAAARMYAKANKAALLWSASPTVHHTNGLQNHRAIISLVGMTGNWDNEGGNIYLDEAWLHVGSTLPTNQEKLVGLERIKDLATPIGHDKFPLWNPFIGEAQTTRIPFQIESGSPYPIKAMVGFGYNKRMWPGCDYFIEQIKKLDFFVNTDLFMTETCKLADLVLPAASTFERADLRFYPGDWINFTQPVIPPVGQAKPDAEIIFEMAQYLCPDDEVFAMGYEKCMDWVLEPTGIKLDTLKQHPNGMPNGAPPVQFKKYKTKGFGTPSGKMEFTSEVLRENGFDALPTYKEPLLSPISTPEIAAKFPLVLGTGARLPMFMHSRTFRNSWDKALHPKPVVYMNPKDAEARGIKHGDAVVLATPRRAINVYADVTGRIMQGVASIYHGYFDAEVNELIEPDYQDPISGFPGYKSLLCEITKA